MCWPFSCLTSKAAVICQGIFCSMREESVNNDTLNISTKWVLILPWWFCLVINIGWISSIDVSMCSSSELLMYLYASCTELCQKYIFVFSLLGKRKLNFQLPCVCSRPHVLGCVSSFHLYTEQLRLWVSTVIWDFPANPSSLKRRKQNKTGIRLLDSLK